VRENVHDEEWIITSRRQNLGAVVAHGIGEESACEDGGTRCDVITTPWIRVSDEAG
jgi:hypothetical protein